MSRLQLFEFCLKRCYNEDMDAEEVTALLYIVLCSSFSLAWIAFGPDIYNIHLHASLSAFFDV